MWEIVDGDAGLDAILFSFRFGESGDFIGAFCGEPFGVDGEPFGVDGEPFVVADSGESVGYEFNLIDVIGFTDFEKGKDMEQV